MTRDTLEHTDHDLNDHLDRRSFSAGFWQTLRAVMREARDAFARVLDGVSVRSLAMGTHAALASAP